jgi:hypothetical protein
MSGIYNLAELSAHDTIIFKRLTAIEDQLAVLSEKAGVPYDSPNAGVPADVVELARSGDRLGAMTRYRALTGADVKTARDVIAGL